MQYFELLDMCLVLFNQIERMEQEYAESIKSIGKAHAQAEEFDLGLEQKAEAVEENNRRAEERHKIALEKVSQVRKTTNLLLKDSNGAQNKLHVVEISWYKVDLQDICQVLSQSSTERLALFGCNHTFS